MIAAAIRFLMTHLPIILAVLALLFATFTRGIPGTAERYLSWLLLLSLGVEAIWGGAFHVFFPSTAAAFVGWQVSPFQFEIGISDLAIGIVAVASFWRGLEFKGAVIAYTVLFYGGVAIGHLRDLISEGNISPGNFGMLFALTIMKFLALPILLYFARRDQRILS